MQEAKLTNTSREFVLWKMYFSEEWNTFSKHDYYLAQIACEVCRLFKKKPDRIKLESFLIKFKAKGEIVPETPEEVAARAARSKQTWMAALFGAFKSKKKKDKETKK